MIPGIAERRLASHRLTSVPANSIVELVAQFGAVQAQDYGAAKWALALRVGRLHHTDVDRAFDAGELLRTHAMRPTWQFVEPATIGWLLELTAPRVHQACGFTYRQEGLDAAMRRRTQRILRRLLADTPHVTRDEIAMALKKSGIEASGIRLAAILIAAELDAVVCSGPRRGKRFTYALFEARVPGGPAMSRDRAVEHLARRYFATHGPATVRDFSWWSGLTVTAAREALEMLGRSIEPERVDGHTYWSMPPVRVSLRRARDLHLLPAFDEFVVGYRDRAAVPYRWPGQERAFLGSIFAGAELVGSWRRKGNGVETVLGRRLTRAEGVALRTAERECASFYAESS